MMTMTERAQLILFGDGRCGRYRVYNGPYGSYYILRNLPSGQVRHTVVIRGESVAWIELR